MRHASLTGNHRRPSGALSVLGALLGHHLGIAPHRRAPVDGVGWTDWARRGELDDTLLGGVR